MKLILFQGDSITDTGRDFNYDPDMGYGYATMTAGKILVDDTPEELFDNPQEPRLKDFLAKVLR